MLIVDEISFASEHVLATLNKKLNLLKETGNEKKFGNIPIVFAGDFTQLEPVGSKPLYVHTENELWFKTVTTFIELKTNHRFQNDGDWGNMLSRIREEGASKDDLKTINSRIVCSANNITEADIPDDSVYATADNNDRAAINDGIFSIHLSKTHSKESANTPPSHTICIKASNLHFKSTNHKGYGDIVSQHAKDIIYATCSDGQVKGVDGKRHDPMLKLYKERPLCINQNIDVENCIANGAMCKFMGITLKDDTVQCIERIKLDGYYVNSIEACHVRSIAVEMIDGNHDPDNPKIIHLPTKSVTPQVYFPMPWDGPITNTTRRIWRKIKFEQFPVNVANARTVHKLQGRSIKNIVISNWNYRGNWVYVVLSRCPTLKGIFLRRPLQKSKPMSDKCKFFHMHFRETKKPKEIQDNIYHYYRDQR